jgi:CubicO group peptidase (beta-lactamase class C family)
MEHAHVPGLAIGIIEEGKIAYTQGYGFADIENNIPVTEETVFHLGSVSKLVTATAVMRLVEDGYLGLDDDINAYLDFEVENPHYPEDKITPRMLLTHSSSIIDDWELYDSLYTIDYGGGDSDISLREYLLSSLSSTGKWYDEKIFLEKRPGTVYEYSNIGFALAGYLVEVISGEDFNVYCNKNIFNPLKMDNTRWFLSELDAAKLAIPYRYENESYLPYPHYGFPSYPDGQLKSNVLDMLSFMQMFLSKRNDAAILREETIQEMLTIQDPGVDYGQAIGWSYSEYNLPFVNNAFLPAKNGEDPGARAIVVVDPTSKSGFVILLNQELENFWLGQKAFCFDLVNKLKNDLGMKNMNTDNQLSGGLVALGIAGGVLLAVWFVAPKQKCPQCDHRFPTFRRKCPKCRGNEPTRGSQHWVDID